MLDQYSHSAIPPEAVTEKDLPALRLGMYNRVQNEPQTRSFIMCDILGGDITQSNYNPIDVINSTLSPLNSAIVNGWNGYYSALYQVNNLLAVTAKFPDSEISVRARGEAHYFRAYIYFCLVSRWGGVPLLRENTLDKLPRSPAADVWALIEEDLDTAASLLDTSESYYYVSRNAALALKARVMLSQGKMTEAAASGRGSHYVGALQARFVRQDFPEEGQHRNYFRLREYLRRVVDQYQRPVLHLWPPNKGRAYTGCPPLPWSYSAPTIRARR